jgi:hypothetical protein
MTLDFSSLKDFFSEGRLVALLPNIRLVLMSNIDYVTLRGRLQALPTYPHAPKYYTKVEGTDSKKPDKEHIGSRLLALLSNIGQGYDGMELITFVKSFIFQSLG